MTGLPSLARFLACLSTGVLTALTAFLLLSAWRSNQGLSFWVQLLEYLVTPAALALPATFAALAGATLVLTKLLALAQGRRATAAGGGAAGLVIALVYGLGWWLSPAGGGQAAAWSGVLVDMVWFSLPQALAGILMAVLWQRL